ncbi:gfo/Idh/MocA family oxidoreductase [Rhodohalobacter sp. SW132]|uniref:Gfo/Idh/MocA family protein n=1 Tax=Rhodohalobacter sp. SW132 TaxID=2293433 RepID=UPI000E281BD2|nr:Gfo/Idh/MocA family oxidoreductase [Rhodohalobacter sp. SW132]REL38049.1 gfo/Idh/MocA family oxidoreductase [Rhodohalobacter sp. SW132]
MSKKTKLGMVGGSLDAFIGEVHRKAAAMDGKFELVCGAFSSSPEKSKKTGEALSLDSSRVYGSYKEMIEKESQLPENERMEAVSIVTPNHVHFEPAKLALENGFHVIIDKPITFSLEEAKQLKKIVDSTGNILALTHTYTGYPMVKQARHMVATGQLGKIRKIYVEYPQGWLSTPLEDEGNKQASWRTDPEKSGAGGAIGDIGTHAANLAEYVSGLNITQISADVNIYVENRRLDDDSAALLKFENDASGVLMATQIAAGEENDLKLRVYGEKGGVKWIHSDPNSLHYKTLDGPYQTLRAGTGYLADSIAKFTRTPAGHPEGYLEAFANIYLEFHNAVSDFKNGNFSSIEDYDFPGADDGIRGMAFVDTMLESNKSETKWTPFKK